jgi:hypothetical protein
LLGRETIVLLAALALTLSVAAGRAAWKERYHSDTMVEHHTVATTEPGGAPQRYLPETALATSADDQAAYIDAEHPTIPLANPAVNTTYAKFLVYNASGQTLYESDLIPPDSHEEYNIYQLYNRPGEYQIGMLVTYYTPVYDGDSLIGFTPCSVKLNNDNITLTVQ